MAAANQDDGLGCLLLIAIGMMVIGGIFMYGPQALFWGGAALIVFIILGLLL